MKSKEMMPIRQSLWQIPVLLILSALLAVGVNHYRAEGISLIGDWSEDARFSDAAVRAW